MLLSTGMLVFAGAALVMALTPGPNMVYLISRSICQRHHQRSACEYQHSSGQKHHFSCNLGL